MYLESDCSRNYAASDKEMEIAQQFTTRAYVTLKCAKHGGEASGEDLDGGGESNADDDGSGESKIDVEPGVDCDMGNTPSASSSKNGERTI